MLTEKRMDIQWLRAIAAAEVVLWHSDLAIKHISPALLAETAYRGIGGIGVELFFIVSGYVISFRAPQYGSGLKFAQSRILRLLPMYWLFTTLVILAQVLNRRWSLNALELDAGFVIQSYLFIPQERYPILMLGWTLEHEMLFYGMVSLLMLMYGSDRRKYWDRMAIMLTLLGFGGVLLGTGYSRQLWDLHITSPYMLCFAIGWTLQRIIDTGWSRDLVVVAALYLMLLPPLAVYCNPTEAALLWRIGLASSVFIAVCAIHKVLQIDCWPNRFAGLVGDASYSIYLSHWFILSPLGKVIGQLGVPESASIAVRLAGILVCIFVGVLIFVRLEKPVDRYLRRSILVRHHPAPIPAAIRQPPAMS